MTTYGAVQAIQSSHERKRSAVLIMDDLRSAFEVALSVRDIALSGVIICRQSGELCIAAPFITREDVN